MAVNTMSVAEQVNVIRATGQVHSNWYAAHFPEVQHLKMHPAEHYLLIGADLGRNPGRGFHTRYYLETYPDAAKSGMNPLLHYALVGAKNGYRTKPPSVTATSKVGKVRSKLLGLGFTDAALSELQVLADTDPDLTERARAARELALWAMRDKSADGYRTALGHVAQARETAPDLAFRAMLSTVELLCHHHLGQTGEGLNSYERAALAGEATPDLMLARSNFEQTPQARMVWINAVLSRFGIAPLALREAAGGADTAVPAYDLLTTAQPLPDVADGPKVTVLIAAYNAADTLPTALRALQEQTWKNLEILVLDDASPDPETMRVAEEFAAHDPRIKAIRMAENAGAYVARNHGLDLATGEFVTIHDADDWSHPQKIEVQVRALLDNPDLMGCKSEQARIFSDLSFTRWTGQGIFIIPNTSSFMFRRAPMREKLGYWDTVRFSADNELVRRMRIAFGRDAVKFLKTGPLSFQRDSDTSIVADDVLGINGFLFGARKEYFDAQRVFHARAGSLKYDASTRPFAVPTVMRPDRATLIDQGRHIPVIVGTEWRMQGGSIESSLEDLRALAKRGQQTAAFQLSRYDLGSRLDILEFAREEMAALGTQVLSYGDEVTCDLLILRYPPALWHDQCYLPKITAREVKVIVNQPPMSDYGPDGVIRYDIATCAANIRRWFGKDAVWHPIGPLVRDALVTHHSDDLPRIDLSPQDWHNIIDINGWDRGPRQRGPQDKLRIGRHSRDNALKWPDTAEDILAAYPEATDVEVHVLGGGNAPSGILGRTPANWTVHAFGSIHPRDFLAGIDVWVYFANPHWVESFGRTIIEAMAAGVPVILPEQYRPLFQNAALYATPQTALGVARKLHADPAAYDRHVELAKDYVRAQFSYEMHYERLKVLK